MFERFTDRARRVIVLAQEDSRLHNHNYIGVEHIILALAREEDGIAAKAMRLLGITVDTLLETVEAGEGPQPSGHIPFTPRAKRVLELALREALQLGHSYIGVEHLLLAVVRDDGEIAKRMLGEDLNAVRMAVLQLQGDHTAASSQIGALTAVLADLVNIYNGRHGGFSPEFVLETWARAQRLVEKGA